MSNHIYKWADWSAAGDAKERARRLQAFVRESNRIEGITRTPAPRELAAHAMLLGCPTLRMSDVCAFVDIVEPGARLRDGVGMNVSVGDHDAMKGGAEVRYALEELLRATSLMTPHRFHLAYLNLHPFTDGNGRSSRALWLWMVGPEGLARPFLQNFYYDALDAYDRSLAR